MGVSVIKYYEFSYLNSRFESSFQEGGGGIIDMNDHLGCKIC